MSILSWFNKKFGGWSQKYKHKLLHAHDFPKDKVFEGSDYEGPASFVETREETPDPHNPNIINFALFHNLRFKTPCIYTWRRDTKDPKKFVRMIK